MHGELEKDIKSSSTIKRLTRVNTGTAEPGQIDPEEMNKSGFEPENSL